jgi:hypothetical protein
VAEMHAEADNNSLKSLITRQARNELRCVFHSLWYNIRATHYVVSCCQMRDLARSHRFRCDGIHFTRPSSDQIKPHLYALFTHRNKETNFCAPLQTRCRSTAARLRREEMKKGYCQQCVLRVFLSFVAIP